MRRPMRKPRAGGERLQTTELRLRMLLLLLVARRGKLLLLLLLLLLLGPRRNVAEARLRELLLSACEWIA